MKSLLMYIAFILAAFLGACNLNGDNKQHSESEITESVLDQTDQVNFKRNDSFIIEDKSINRQDASQDLDEIAHVNRTPETKKKTTIAEEKPLSEMDGSDHSKEKMNLKDEDSESLQSDKDALVKPGDDKIKDPVEKDPEISEKVAKPDHAPFDAQLRKFVSNGKVNYNSWKKEEAQLDAYLDQLGINEPEGSWSRNEKLAYWINVYNAYTIKLILKNYPVKQITQLHGGKPWDVKWIKIGGNTYSLNQIENEIIRPRFKEPRIHFAVNCAAVSCPPLASVAFTADNLNSLLESQTKSFINNTAFNTMKPGQVSVSKIFDWYKEDFGNLVEFLDKYSTVDLNSNAKVTFMEYNWNLNGK